MWSSFFSLFLKTSTRHLKVGQKDSVGTKACHISIKSEGCVLNDMTLVGGIRLNYKGIKSASLMPVVFEKKVLEKYLSRNRG